MPILKVKDKDKIIGIPKLIGAYIPQQVWGYLTLFSLAHGISKTTVIRNEILHWQTSQMEQETDLIKLLIKRAREEQKKWVATKGSFKKTLKDDLKRKEISDEHISTILTALE